jgi:hypothetical protein
MTLARAWTRQLYTASAAALLVPGTIAGALVLLAFAGGFGQLGALGQALSGPAVPSALRSAVIRSSSGPSPVLARILANAVPTATTAAVSHGASTSVAAPRGSVGGVSVQLGGGVGSATQSQQSNPGGASVHTQSPGPGGGSSPTQTPVNQVVSNGQAVANQVPGPVGSLASQTLQSIGGTLNRLVPPPASLIPPRTSLLPPR